MSRIYYFAADHALDEQPNPYISLLSVNQALARGIDVDTGLLDASLDFDKPNIILVCEDESKFLYPSIRAIRKEDFYDDIGTKKPFCAELEWSYSDDTAAVVLEYIRRQLNTAEELELWSVWLGSDAIIGGPEIPRFSRCSLAALDLPALQRFFADDTDYHCMVIHS